MTDKGQPVQHTQAGLWWPAADPDRLRAAAQAWRQAQAALERVQTASTAAVYGVTAANEGPAVDAFRTFWQEKFAGNAGALTAACQGCQEMADALTRYASEVDQARRRIEALIAEIATAAIVGIGLSIITVGISDVAATGIAAGLTAAASAAEGSLLATAADIAASVITGAGAGAAISAVSDVIVQGEHLLVFHDVGTFSWNEVLSSAEFGAVGGGVGGTTGALGERVTPMLGRGPSWLWQPLVRSTTGAGAATVTDELTTGRVDPLDAVMGGVGGASPALRRRSSLEQKLAGYPGKVDLPGEEGRDGHTIRKHVAQSIAVLRGSGKPVHSTFADLRTAEAAVTTVVHANIPKIIEWQRAGADLRLELEGTWSEPVGIVRLKDKSIVSTNHYVVWLLKTRDSQIVVKSAYPVAEP